MPIPKYLATAALASFIAVNSLAESTKDWPEGERLGDIPFEERMYTKADLDYILSLIKPGGGGGDCPCTNIVRRYPMFIIHLNTTQGFDENGYTLRTQFSGFELKASTNDFSHAVSESKRVLYWCGPHMSGENHADMDNPESLLAFMCESYTNTPSSPINDYRSWVPLYNDSALTPYPEYVAVILDIEKFTRTPDNTWCDSENDEIVWVFMRFSNEGREEGEGGYPIWNPIQPVKWLKKLPNWVVENGFDEK